MIMHFPAYAWLKNSNSLVFNN